MECAICGQQKIDEGLVIFSKGAYVQVLSILKKDDHKIMPESDRPVHVCRDCLQGAYQYSKR